MSWCNCRDETFEIHLIATSDELIATKHDWWKAWLRTIIPPSGYNRSWHGICTLVTQRRRFTQRHQCSVTDQFLELILKDCLRADWFACRVGFYARGLARWQLVFLKTFCVLPHQTVQYSWEREDGNIQEGDLIKIFDKTPRDQVFILFPCMLSRRISDP